MSCQRYPSEGLTGFPPTAELREHLTGCADCQAAERSYARLERLVAVAGARAQPPLGWEQRLNERLARGPRSRFPLRSVVLVVSALAASLVAMIFLPRRGASDPLLPPQTELIAAGGSRAASAAVGGTWKVSVDSRQELRVWHNQQTLVLRCGAGPAEGCEPGQPRRVAKVPLSAPGEYRAMILTPAPGSPPLPEPVSFDQDARLAREQGASYQVLEPIVAY